MKEIKCVAFDIDGTLIARGKDRIEASTKVAIKQLKEKGIKIIVATGRAFYFIQEDVKDFLQPDFFVTVNGQVVTDKSGNAVADKRLNVDESNAILKACRQHQIKLANKGLKQMEVYVDYENYWRPYLRNDETKRHILVNREDLVEFTPETAPHGMFLIGDEQTIRSFSPLLNDLQLSYAFQDAFELFDKRVGKSDGIEIALKHYGIPWEETMVFGDANNDIQMLEKAGISVAMGNASADCKAHADYVTTEITNDGIYNALKHFNLIK